MRRNYEESIIQVKIVKHLRKNKIFVYSSLNAGARSAASGRRMKLEGMLAGVSDLTIHLYNKTVFVEIKKPTGTLSKSQKEFKKNVEALGFEYIIWRSLSQAMDWCKENV